MSEQDDENNDLEELEDDESQERIFISLFTVHNENYILFKLIIKVMESYYKQQLLNIYCSTNEIIFRGININQNIYTQLYVSRFFFTDWSITQPYHFSILIFQLSGILERAYDEENTTLEVGILSDKSKFICKFTDEDGKKSLFELPVHGIEERTNLYNAALDNTNYTIDIHFTPGRKRLAYIFNDFTVIDFSKETEIFFEFYTNPFREHDTIVLTRAMQDISEPGVLTKIQPNWIIIDEINGDNDERSIYDYDIIRKLYSFDTIQSKISLYYAKDFLLKIHYDFTTHCLFDIFTTPMIEEND